MDDVQFDDEVQFDDDVQFDGSVEPTSGGLDVYLIREKGGGKELGKVSATSNSDAMAQAEGMGYKPGTISIVKPEAKPVNQQEREDLLVKRGLSREDAASISKFAPYTAESFASRNLEDYPSLDLPLVGRVPFPDTRDAFSLPGRTLSSWLGGTNDGEDQWRAMGRTSEDEGTNFGGSVVRSPSTGVATALAPLASLVGGAAGITNLFGAGALEGGLIGAGTSTYNYATNPEYTVLDGVAETLLSAGIGSLLSGGSASAIKRAKDMIRKAGNFTKDQVEYIYSRLGTLTHKQTTDNLAREVPERIGDVANIRYKNILRVGDSPEIKIPGAPSDHVYVTTDLGGTIGNDVIKTFERDITDGIFHRTLTPAQVREKQAILEEFKQWMSTVDKVDPRNGRKYLDRWLEDAKYFYKKDPRLGQIMLNKVQKAYEMNYQLMENTPLGMIELEPLSNLTSDFGKISATTDYLGTPHTPAPTRNFSVTEPGSWLESTVGRAINTPEKAKTTSELLSTLKMPSLVATQDVTGKR